MVGIVLDKTQCVVDNLASLWTMLVLRGFSLGPPEMSSRWRLRELHWQGPSSWLHVVASVEFCVKPPDCCGAGTEPGRGVCSGQCTCGAGGARRSPGRAGMSRCSLDSIQTKPFPRHLPLMKGKLFAVTLNWLSRQNMNVSIK